MLKYPVIPCIESGIMLATVVPEVNQVHITQESPEGSRYVGSNALPSVIEPPVHRGAEVYIDKLCEIQLRLGPGAHDAETVRQAGLKPKVNGLQRRLGYEAFSPEFVQYDTTTESGMLARIVLGNFMFASRKATAEELATRTERLAPLADPKMLYGYERVQMEDAEKVDLSLQDHVRITFEEQSFIMRLDDPEALLATRIAQYFAEAETTNETTILGYSDVRLAVWSKMTIAERMMFTSKEKELYAEQGEAIADAVEMTITGLFGRLGITKRANISGRLELSQSPLAVAIEAVPVEYSDINMEEVTPIFSPGTSKETIIGQKPHVVSEQDLQRAQEYLRMARLSDGIHLTHEEAIALMDHIMTVPGKRALMDVMGLARSDVHKSKFSNVLQELHSIAQRSLGYHGYNVAHYNRMISGNSSGKFGRARQVGGRLSGATTKWYIGRT